MDIQGKLERDLKTALLSGDKSRVETLKGIKNAIQYKAVDVKTADKGLTEEQILQLLSKEAKKRQEAADLYRQAGEAGRAEAELSEKKIIEEYLPAKLSDEEVLSVIREEISKIPEPAPADMGRIIGLVKARLGAQADGSTIARLVKEVLSNQ